MARLVVLGVLFLLAACVYADGPNQACVSCSQSGQAWCSTTQACAPFTNSTLPACASGWCTGDTCECTPSCTTGTYPCSETYPGLLILLAFYGLLLSFGAKLISDGSELLLEILNPGLIGGLLLPILGALPDAAIIIVSGALGDDPQNQVAVGMGTLAGSTIMLLTLPWAASIFLGKCDIKAGEAIDGLNTRFSWVNQGVTVDNDTPINARIMIATSFSYFIVQGVAFAYLHDEDSGKKLEGKFAIAGFIVCALSLCAYCAYQVLSPKLQEKKMAEAKRRHIAHMTIKRLLYNMQVRVHQTQASTSTTPLLSTPPSVASTTDVRAIGLKWKAAAHKKAEERKTGDIQQTPRDVEAQEGTDEHVDAKKIALKAALLMGIGTLMVSIFSDPMVDVITDLGEKMRIKAFFVSFIVTPFCSNASELISSLMFASGKKRANASLTFSQLYGAATMNNTLCLGIFFILVFARNLTWSFSAETMTIFTVTNIVGLIAATRTTFRLWYAPLILCLYPLSLVMVYILETFVGWK
eukprot:TRINITY_DN962_c0_g1_i4.p1 TRINITY_DN962_c0_g1~~TRINITY_DN962_c0_g1_i4.p1  ORF type:complete len:533 (-),score=157.93 TRINITY_DN962_c0_g1_i4:1133-2707(-)